MNRELIATTSISIFASPLEVWKSLIDPDIIKQYMHGTETQTTWELHTPITFRGEWEGVPYVDKGEIVEIIPERVLSYTYWSPLSGTEDFEDNYAIITYHISPYDDETTLTVTQDNIEDEDKVVAAEENWMKTLTHLKKILELKNH
ncbi:SRPBCC domain-containing protein [Dyadobacter subterraneus]|uniref:SRPBCC domain-containing protein n=1 Tax=Dyadobacter subterraneus TaxID=2773304 RepID=A0ABR9WBS1_9BACT|nr:SRPBCC domain-containing protein [Dyadobacter subterraneus]MBE9462907.1 SRPBCC domain-containing protein [Dyadobacter subterraneus]